jgi:hypothetical protein
MSLFIRLFGIFCIYILYSYEEGHKIQDAFSKYMKFGETLLEFSKGTLFHDIYLVAYTYMAHIKVGRWTYYTGNFIDNTVNL